MMVIIAGVETRPLLRGRLNNGFYLLVERLLTWCISPYLRAALLGLFGASVGRNVRIYEARFFNLFDGFRNLTVEDNVHIGTGCLLDLSDHLSIGKDSVLSPRVIVLTHSDPGAYHDAALARIYPRRTAPVTIHPSSWIGANAVILCGSEIGPLSVVGANSLVTGSVPPAVVVAGSPARKVGDIDVDAAGGTKPA